MSDSLSAHGHVGPKYSGLRSSFTPVITDGTYGTCGEGILEAGEQH